jgi:hypothetical protein
VVYQRHSHRQLRPDSRCNDGLASVNPSYKSFYFFPLSPRGRSRGSVEGRSSQVSGDCTAPLDGACLSSPKVQEGGSLAGKLSASVSSIISSRSFSSVPSLPLGLLPSIFECRTPCLCHLRHRTRDPGSSLRDHLREAGHRNADHKVAIRTLRQRRTRRVLKASRTAPRYLSGYAVIDASTRIVLPGWNSFFHSHT